LNELEGFLPGAIQESFDDRLVEGCQRVVVSLPAWHVVIPFLFMSAFVCLTLFSLAGKSRALRSTSECELVKLRQQHALLSRKYNDLQSTTVSKVDFDKKALELTEMTKARDSLSEQFQNLQSTTVSKVDFDKKALELTDMTKERDEARRENDAHAGGWFLVGVGWIVSKVFFGG
jgi:hypothetical protein